MLEFHMSPALSSRTPERARYVPLRAVTEAALNPLNHTDLGGITIPVAVTNYPPFLWVLHGERNTDKDIAGSVLGKGTSWELMRTLAAFFNFRPEPRVALGDVVGRRDAEGRWMGALELLKEEEAEFTVLPVTVSSPREEIVDFSILLGTTTFGILVRRPAYVPKPDALLRPFNVDVWLWILAMMGIMGPLIYLIILLRVRLCRGDPTLTRTFPLDQCIWFVFGAMMKQGSVLSPISDSSRILFATWWLFITIVTSFYTANLTAYLTFNSLVLPIEKAEDLARDPDIKWAAFRDGALADIIMVGAGYGGAWSMRYRHVDNGAKGMEYHHGGIGHGRIMGV
ncbi:glutamate receptor ionotropic, kainate 3-like [Penaeus monodon]|uniref:glutamate receptor ionotropic, kainate 3-like n=1 Tax=Penaeus monodon TaxID=6687 RepID=UPI0018A70D90|nr:glutamate receptor ionotropic, kainate 3-like [Penaeus monodon]